MLKRLWMIVGIIAMGIFAIGCSPVPAGNVGVKIDKYGDERGVNVTVLSPLIVTGKQIGRAHV